MNVQLKRTLYHIAECQKAELRNYWKRASFLSDYRSIREYFESNRQWGEFTKNYIYTLRKKEEQVTKKHILMIEKFCAVWIKEHTRNQVLAVDVLIGMVKCLTKFDKT